MEKAARRKLTTYKKQTGSMDFSILLVVTILCAFGLVMVFSASYYYAIHTQYGDGYYYLRKQLIYMAMGYPMMLIVSRVNYRYLDKLRYMFLVVSVILLILVLFIAVGSGVMTLPMILAKVGVIYLSTSLSPR